MQNKDKLLKILIAIATFLILISLGFLAIMNFSGNNNDKSSDRTTTSVRQITSVSNSQSTTKETSSTEKTSETSMVSKPTSKAKTEQAPKVNSNTTTKSATANQNAELEKAIKENANEGRGEPTVAISDYTKVFPTQSEAHAYAAAEVQNLSAKLGRTVNYEIRAVKDSNGKVTGWEANIQ